MADEEQSITLELPADDVEPIVEALEQAEDPIAVLQKQYDELKAQDESRAKALETAQQNANTAREEAKRNAQEAERARTQVVSSELQANVNAIAMEQATLDAAKRDYREALESGNYDKAADAQERLSTATANKVNLERERNYLETRAPVTEGRVEPRQTELPVDPVERALAISAANGAAFSERSANWLRQHPEVVTNSLMGKRAALADEEARQAGIRTESDEYFRFIEERMAPQQTQQTTRPRSMPAAPPSREPAPTNGGKKTVDVQLSAAERKSATDGTLTWNTGPNKGKPLGVEEMARRKHLMADRYKGGTNVN